MINQFINRIINAALNKALQHPENIVFLNLKVFSLQLDRLKTLVSLSMLKALNGEP